MNLQITIVPHGHINQVLPKVIGYVRKMEPYLYGRAGVDSVIKAMLNPEIQTWIIYDEDEVVHFYATTQIAAFPLGKNLMVLNCGGRDGVMDEMAPQMLHAFEQFARGNGCKGIDIQGRPGWKKWFSPAGFETSWAHYFKALEDKE
jgi:hypothetical protein